MSEIHTNINLNHRFNLIQDLNKELEGKEENTKNILKNKKKDFQLQLENFRSELSSLSSEIDILIKKIYKLGNDLRDKVDIKEFNFLKEKIDAWRLEEFAHKKELERIFKKYSKK